MTLDSSVIHIRFRKEVHGVDQGGGDLTRLRQLNARAVIRALRGAEPLASTEVARRTGLSRASTERHRARVAGAWLDALAATLEVLLDGLAGHSNGT